ncbi:HNH endonuclease [Hydrogenophaga pseudoflava]|uniref:HNH endonuclease n=1 Tax=Hydrogenophaga pseudoflava TaxID=47421 RepID=UPI0008244C6A|nr:HNH endonuclease signature motif containing protein [Hydrogenophaga pseudoflava]
MPSALLCKRRAEQDLDALHQYASTYRGKDWKARVQQVTTASKHLERVFLNYSRLFEKPRWLLQARLRGIASLLHDLYDSKAEPFRYIAELRNYERFGACPYCGLPKNITVDHYLPRNHKAFPHLSFLSLNLVPACSDCQGSKGSFYPYKPAMPAKAYRSMGRLRLCEKEKASIKKARRAKTPPAPSLRVFEATPLRPNKVLGVQETRRFIHPYLDEFLHDGVFDVGLVWSGGRPEIGRFLWKRHLTDAQRALVLFHVGKMKVKDRSRGIVRRLHMAFEKYIAGKSVNREEVVDRLKFLLDTLQERTGLANSIEAKYFEALLRDPAAINQLVAASAAPKPKPLTHVSTAVRKTVSHRRGRA